MPRFGISNLGSGKVGEAVLTYCEGKVPFKTEHGRHDIPKIFLGN